MDEFLKLVGAIMPIVSAVASLINHIVRQDAVEGKEPNKALIATGAVLNVGAVNVDKAMQLAKMIGATAPKTEAEKPKAKK